MGVKNKQGYGGFSCPKLTGRKMSRANRAAWIIYRGPIPENMLVLHKCDNPPCVNPDHLFLGSDRDNAVDAYKKGHLYIPIGEKHHNAKLNREKILAIRQSYAQGISMPALAKTFGVCRQTIFRTVHFTGWAHLK